MRDLPRHDLSPQRTLDFDHYTVARYAVRARSQPRQSFVTNQTEVEAFLSEYLHGDVSRLVFVLVSMFHEHVREKLSAELFLEQLFPRASLVTRKGLYAESGRAVRSRYEGSTGFVPSGSPLCVLRGFDEVRDAWVHIFDDGKFVEAHKFPFLEHFKWSASKVFSVFPGGLKKGMRVLGILTILFLCALSAFVRTKGTSKSLERFAIIREDGDFGKAYDAATGKPGSRLSWDNMLPTLYPLEPGYTGTVAPEPTIRKAKSKDGSTCWCPRAHPYDFRDPERDSVCVKATGQAFSNACAARCNGFRDDEIYACKPRMTLYRTG